jgi:hypothetical protein
MGRRGFWRTTRTKIKFQWDPRRTWPLATGLALDEIAENYGVRRMYGEPDSDFRERILEEIR